jgi:hypothetical protein
MKASTVISPIKTMSKVLPNMGILYHECMIK